MKIFEMNDQIKNFKYPVIKIIVCIIIYLLLFHREKIFKVSALGNLVMTVLTVIIIIPITLCIVISVIEIVELKERRIEIRRDISELTIKNYTVKEIYELVEDNDILEIELKDLDSVLKVGCTSDNKWSDNVFFDKAYYWGDEENLSAKEFKKRIESISKDGVVQVIAIDGIFCHEQ